jgi:hypothetical protein
MIPPTARSVLARRHWRKVATITDRSRSGRVRHRPDLMRVCPGGLVTDRVAAKTCGVCREMVRLWVETGAWPLPRGIIATTLYFTRSDVEGWLRTGTWPAEARFQGRPLVGHVKT